MRRISLTKPKPLATEDYHRFLKLLIKPTTIVAMMVRSLSLA
jgi:hypothetical protein